MARTVADVKKKEKEAKKKLASLAVSAEEKKKAKKLASAEKKTTNQAATKAGARDLFATFKDLPKADAEAQYLDMTAAGRAALLRAVAEEPNPHMQAGEVALGLPEFRKKASLTVADEKGVLAELILQADPNAKLTKRALVPLSDESVTAKLLHLHGAGGEEPRPAAPPKPQIPAAPRLLAQYVEQRAAAAAAAQGIPEPLLQLPDMVADAVAAFEAMVAQTDAKVDKLAEVIRARYPKRSAGTKAKSRTIKRGNRRKNLRNAKVAAQFTGRGSSGEKEASVGETSEAEKGVGSAGEEAPSDRSLGLNGSRPGSSELAFNAAKTAVAAKAAAKEKEDGTEADEAGALDHLGFPNLGNSCYINSVLQALLALDEFCEATLQLFRKAREARVLKALSAGFHKNKKPLFLIALGELLERREKKLSVERSLRNIKDAAAFWNPTFEGSKEEDAHEFLVLFLDRLSADFNMVTSVIETMKKDEPSAAEVELRALPNPVEEFFRFNISTTIVCEQCGEAKAPKEESFLCLSLPLQTEMKKPTIEDLIGAALRPESTPVNCGDSQCGHTIGLLHRTFTKTPKILMVNVVRHCVERETGATLKNGSQVRVSPTLDLAKLRHHHAAVKAAELARGTGAGGCVSFELQAVVSHKGASLNTGHYYTERAWDDSWIKLSDDHPVTWTCLAEGSAKRAKRGYIYAFAGKDGSR